MLQLCGEADLEIEAVHAQRCRHLRREHLDDDLPVEGDFMGQEHARHPAAAKLALDAIARSKCGLQLAPQIRFRCGERAARRV